MAAARGGEAADATAPPVLRVPGDYATVPEAVAAAQPGGGPELVATWRQPRGKSYVNATRFWWHLWEIDSIFAHVLPPGWLMCRKDPCVQAPRLVRTTKPPYRGTSLIRNRLLLGPYSRSMPKAL